MKVGIGAAVYISNEEHFQFAKETIESVKSADHELIFCFVINFVAKREYRDWLNAHGIVLDNTENIVSRSWNRAIETLITDGCDYVIVPNMDLVFKSNLVDNLVKFADAHPEFILWTALPWGEKESIEEAVEGEGFPETPHFSCFMVDRRLFERIGKFDENFRAAYDEDIDMHYRIKLAGETAVGWEGARFFHQGGGSRTIKSDPDLERRNHITHDANDKYFIAKWAYKPPTADDAFTQGMYKHPFNDPNYTDEFHVKR
jgi:GT2 family glycosyltransferase